MKKWILTLVLALSATTMGCAHSHKKCDCSGDKTTAHKECGDKKEGNCEGKCQMKKSEEKKG